MKKAGTRKSFTEWFKSLSEEDQNAVIPYLKAERDYLKYRAKIDDYRNGHPYYVKVVGNKL